MVQYLPKFDGGVRQTVTLTGTVIGGRLITSAGAHTGADATNWLGVVSHDGTAGDDRVCYSGATQRLTASAAITKGALVKCAAAGKVTTSTVGTDASERVVGLALDAATADGDVIAVQMER